MHKLKFTSEDGTISCSITVNNSIPKDRLEPIFRSLMLHLETSVGIYPERVMFDNLTRLRGEFYSKVLKLIVDENLEKGQEVPSHILKHISGDSKPKFTGYYDD